MNYEQEMLDFKMRLLQAEIRMNGMIAENERRKTLGQSMAYVEDDFVRLIEEYRIHTNAFPDYRGY
jgi:hypothetical protein